MINANKLVAKFATTLTKDNAYIFRINNLGYPEREVYGYYNNIIISVG